MLNELKTLAGKKQITVPTDNNAAASHMQAMQGATGNEFDKMWLTHMVEMHEMKVAELQNAMNQATDPDIKAAATKAHPMVKKHTETLQAYKSQMQ
jgi:putative membrane protein